MKKEKKKESTVLKTKRSPNPGEYNSSSISFLGSLNTNNPNMSPIRPSVKHIIPSILPTSEYELSQHPQVGKLNYEISALGRKRFATRKYKNRSQTQPRSPVGKQSPQYSKIPNINQSRFFTNPNNPLFPANYSEDEGSERNNSVNSSVNSNMNSNMNSKRSQKREYNYINNMGNKQNVLLLEQTAPQPNLNVLNEKKEEYYRYKYKMEEERVGRVYNRLGEMLSMREKIMKMPRIRVISSRDRARLEVFTNPVEKPYADTPTARQSPLNSKTTTQYISNKSNNNNNNIQWGSGTSTQHIPPVKTHFSSFIEEGDIRKCKNLNSAQLLAARKMKKDKQRNQNSPQKSLNLHSLKHLLQITTSGGNHRNNHGNHGNNQLNHGNNGNKNGNHCNSGDESRNNYSSIEQDNSLSKINQYKIELPRETSGYIVNDKADEKCLKYYINRMTNRLVKGISRRDDPNYYLRQPKISFLKLKNEDSFLNKSTFADFYQRKQDMLISTNSKYPTSGFLDICNTGIQQPPAMEGPAIATIHKDSNFYIYGGHNIDTHNKLYIYNSDVNKWEKVEPNPFEEVTGAYNMSTISYKQYIAYFGGEIRSKTAKCLSSLTVLDLASNRINTVETNVTARRSHIMANYGRYVFIYGGVDTENNILSDLHCMNIMTQREEKIEYSSPTIIGGLAFAACAPIFYSERSDPKVFDEYPDVKWGAVELFLSKEGIYIFGGVHTYSQPCNTLWRFKSKAGAVIFKEIGEGQQIHGTPPLPRYSHTMNYCRGINALVVFGGRNDKQFKAKTGPVLNDIIIFTLEMFGKDIPHLYSHGSAIYGGTKIFVFGGIDQKFLYSDKGYIFEFNQNKVKEKIKQYTQQVFGVRFEKMRRNSLIHSNIQSNKLSK